MVCTMTKLLTHTPLMRILLHLFYINMCWFTIERLLLIETEEKKARQISTHLKQRFVKHKYTNELRRCICIAYGCLAGWMWSNDDNLAQCICATLSSRIEHSSMWINLCKHRIYVVGTELRTGSLRWIYFRRIGIFRYWLTYFWVQLVK